MCHVIVIVGVPIMDLPLLSLSLNDDAETGMTPEQRRIQASIKKRRDEARQAASKRNREQIREANRLAKQNNPKMPLPPPTGP